MMGIINYINRDAMKIEMKIIFDELVKGKNKVLAMQIMNEKEERKSKEEQIKNTMAIVSDKFVEMVGSTKTNTSYRRSLKNTKSQRIPEVTGEFEVLEEDNR